MKLHENNYTMTKTIWNAQYCLNNTITIYVVCTSFDRIIIHSIKYFNNNLTSNNDITFERQTRDVWTKKKMMSNALFEHMFEWLQNCSRCQVFAFEQFWIELSNDWVNIVAIKMKESVGSFRYCKNNNQTWPQWAYKHPDHVFPGHLWGPIGHEYLKM